MTQTVVGVFDDYTQAQRALTELTDSGFDIQNVKLDPEEQHSEARQRALRGDEDNDSDGGGIMGFFRSLFGTDDSDTTRQADVYSEAVRRGSYMLTVHADSDEQAERACDIMNRYDPVDIDERSSQWQSQGWTRYDTSSPVLSDDEITQERSRYASSGTMTGSQSTLSDDTADRLQSRTGGSTEGETRIPVVQEELQVGKRMVQRGGVRVFQRVIDTPVHEQVQLREEHVTIDRRPVDQPASEADLAGLKDASFEMRESAEEAVVAKSARVVEEVVVNKEVSERTQTIDDTVRRTDVQVEQLGAGQSMSATGSRDTMSTAGTGDLGSTTGSGMDPSFTTTGTETRSGMGGMGQSAGSGGMGATSFTSGMNNYDDEFRSHWQTTYGTSAGSRYEDYAPAYQFGNQMHSDSRYTQHQWNDVEPDIRSSWEQQHGSHPWERVKDAVRYGWDKVSK